MIEAADGTAARERAYAESPEVLVLDAMMPGADGTEVAADLRARGVDCAIIILSARGQATDLRRAYDVGVDDYVIKPFDGSDLVRRVRAAWEARRAQRPER